MILTNSEVEFCMKCGNPNTPDREICECGGRNFVFGNDFIYKNKKVVCNCGNDKFEKISHVNMPPFYNATYKCSKCRNIVATQIYYESPYFSIY
jgi:hypothetical protein